MSSHLTDFNARNESLKAKLLQQGYRYHKLRKSFSKFYRRHFELFLYIILDYDHYCNKACQNLNFIVTDLVNKFRKVVGKTEFSDHLTQLSCDINALAMV